MSPGRYEGWAEGKRMSSDLTIGNVALQRSAHLMRLYFIVSDPQGKMRQADLKDYGEEKVPGNRQGDRRSPGHGLG